MTKDDIIWRLACLASLPYQDRYVLNGTADEYRRDDELLQDVDALEFPLQRPENRAQVTAEQLDALEGLFAFMAAKGDEALAPSASSEEAERKIREGATWRDLRDRAGSVLELFGIPRTV